MLHAAAAGGEALQIVLQRLACTVPRTSLIRMAGYPGCAVGIEDIDDLLADLDQAFQQAATAAAVGGAAAPAGASA